MFNRSLPLLLLAATALACSDSGVTAVPTGARAALATPPPATLPPPGGPAGSTVTLTVTGLPVPCPTCADKTSFGILFTDAKGNGSITGAIPADAPLGPFEISA